MSEQTLTIGTREFFGLVDAVVPFAGRDDMLPVLCAVRIESRGTHLLATATDRFRVGVKRLKAEGDEPWPEFAITLPLASYRAIKQMFRPMRGMSPDLTLVADDVHLNVEAGGALLDALSARATFMLALGEYPKVLSIINEGLARTSEPLDGFAVNTKFLAEFAKIGGPVVSIKPDARKPLIFTDGQDFVGALMPRKAEVAEGIFPDLSDWSALLDPTPTKAKTTRKKVA